MAFDAFKIVPDHHHSKSSQNTPSDHDSHDGDHCCHSAAHFVSLVSSISLYQPEVSGSQDLSAQFNFLSQPRHPPTPPPIV